MGYETTVSSVTQSLYTIEEEAGKASIAGMAYKGEFPKIPKILDTIYNGPATSIHSAVRYARDTYTYGLPDGYTEVIGDASPEKLEEVLTAEFGTEMELITYQIGEADDLFWAKEYSYHNYGYRDSTGHLTDPPIAPEQGYHVKIHETVFDSAGRLRVTWNRGYKEISTGPGSSQKVMVTSTTTILDSKKPDPTKLYYHIRCRNKGSDTTNYIFWIYEVGSGKHPDLDFERDEESLNSPYMPIIPLREFNKPFGPEMEKELKEGEEVPASDAAMVYKKDEKGNYIRPDTELYKTSVKLCKLLNVNFDDIHLQVHQSPSIKDIDHIYMMFGIDINTETPSGKNYLADFFEDMAFKDMKTGVTIKDASYRMAVNWSSINRTVVQGEQPKTASIQSSGNTLTIRKRIDATTYALIVVEGLIHRNYVYGNHRVDTSLANSAEDEKFIVPLSYELFTRTKGMYHRADLIKEAFKLVFNSYDRRKMKWYESGAFKIIMVIVNITIAIITVGASIPIQAGIMAAIWATIQQIIINFVVSYGVKWLAAQVDPNLALMIAVAAIGLGMGMSEGSSIIGLTADNFLSIGMATFGGIQQGIQEDMEDLQKDMNEFAEEAERQEEELQELMDDLTDEELWFEDLVSEMTDKLMYETPDEFYTRTIHAGNIGVASLNVIENYVDKQLELPEFKEI